MPQLKKIFVLDVTPEKFLDNCSPEELMEVSLLVLSQKYQYKIKVHLKEKETNSIQE